MGGPVLKDKKNVIEGDPWALENRDKSWKG